MEQNHLGLSKASIRNPTTGSASAISALTLSVNSFASFAAGDVWGQTFSPLLPAALIAFAGLCGLACLCLSRSSSVFQKFGANLLFAAALFGASASLGATLSPGKMENIPINFLTILILLSLFLGALLVRRRTKKALLYLQRTTPLFLASGLLATLLLQFQDAAFVSPKFLGLFCGAAFFCGGSLVGWFRFDKPVRHQEILQINLSLERLHLVICAYSLAAGLGVLHYTLVSAGKMTEAACAISASSTAALGCFLLFREGAKMRRQFTVNQAVIIEELETVSRSWEMLLGQMPDMFFVVDREHRLVYINEVACNAFGSKSIVKLGIGERMVDRLPDYEQSDFFKAYEEVFSTSRVSHFDAMWGADHYFRGVAYPSGDNVSVCLRNVTQERLLQQAILAREECVLRASKKLARSNKDLQHFAYVASHDLREPLRTITSFGGLLASRAGPILTGDATHFLEEIVAGAHRMRKLIDDLLAYARIQETPQVRCQPIKVEDIVTQVKRDLRTALHESRGEVVVLGSLPELIFDPVQMKQLLQNLIGNALKFRKHNVAPKIEISGEILLNGDTMMRVCDNGIGIAPEHLKRIFTVFQRLHTREEYAGTGIGLAICKRIVDHSGGEIWAESDRHTGTRFHLLWRAKIRPKIKPEVSELEATFGKEAAYTEEHFYRQASVVS